MKMMMTMQVTMVPKPMLIPIVILFSNDRKHPTAVVALTVVAIVAAAAAVDVQVSCSNFPCCCCCCCCCPYSYHVTFFVSFLMMMTIVVVFYNCYYDRTMKILYRRHCHHCRCHCHCHCNTPHHMPITLHCQRLMQHVISFVVLTLYSITNLA